MSSKDEYIENLLDEVGLYTVLRDVVREYRISLYEIWKSGDVVGTETVLRKYYPHTYQKYEETKHEKDSLIHALDLSGESDEFIIGAIDVGDMDTISKFAEQSSYYTISRYILDNDLIEYADMVHFVYRYELLKRIKSEEMAIRLYNGRNQYILELATIARDTKTLGEIVDYEDSLMNRERGVIHRFLYKCMPYVRDDSILEYLWSEIPINLPNENYTPSYYLVPFIKNPKVDYFIGALERVLSVSDEIISIYSSRIEGASSDTFIYAYEYGYIIVDDIISFSDVPSVDSLEYLEYYQIVFDVKVGKITDEEYKMLSSFDSFSVYSRTYHALILGYYDDVYEIIRGMTMDLSETMHERLSSDYGLPRMKLDELDKIIYHVHDTEKSLSENPI